MWYYAKHSLFLFIYMLTTILTATGISLIEAEWVQSLLAVLNIGLYLFLTAIYMYKEGGEAAKKLHANDIDRENIVKTGNYIKINKIPEFRVWKGSFMSFITFIPMIVLFVVHTILGLTTGSNTAGTIANVVYMTFYMPYAPFLGTVMRFELYYILLYAIPLITISIGVAYNIGARKILRQYKKVQETQKMLYGDKN